MSDNNPKATKKPKNYHYYVIIVFHEDRGDEYHYHDEIIVTTDTEKKLYQEVNNKINTIAIKTATAKGHRTDKWKVIVLTRLN
jgi:hypothetical protein